MDEKFRQAVEALGKANSLLTQQIQANKIQSDLITAQDDCIVKFREELKRLREELKRLREERRCIPVEERLPSPDDGPYSTYEDVSAVSVLAVIEGAEWATELYFDGYDFFDIQGDEMIPYRVTHWKPMPKGPEVSHD